MGLETSWSRAFLGRGNTLDNRESHVGLFHLPRSLISLTLVDRLQSEFGTPDHPYQPAEFDSWRSASTKVWKVWPCQKVCRVWLLLIHFESEFGKCDLAQQSAGAWLLEIWLQPEVWNVWPGQTVCKIWLFGDVSSTRVWNMWPYQTVCRNWLLDLTSTRVWKVWPCLTVCRSLTFGSNRFNQNLGRMTLPDSLQTLTFGCALQPEFGSTWPCQTVCWNWLLDLTSTRVWDVWPCLESLQEVDFWNLTSTGAWNTWPCLAVCWIWVLDDDFDQSLARVDLA